MPLAVGDIISDSRRIAESGARPQRHDVLLVDWWRSRETVPSCDGVRLAVVDIISVSRRLAETRAPQSRGGYHSIMSPFSVICIEARRLVLLILRGEWFFVAFVVICCGILFTVVSCTSAGGITGTIEWHGVEEVPIPRSSGAAGNGVDGQPGLVQGDAGH